MLVKGTSYKLKSILNNFKIPLIVQYFLSMQLADPYSIRAAHGQNQFLEVPFIQRPSETDLFKTLKKPTAVVIHIVK